ncbi:tetratricopeptide repeat protein [Altererythrobacter aurantiacus]|uniref:Tetratricopeptide repeat protein n=1 Tax=Parapontixanthobacter aurantiacus TaxID=1463599 RepID=A0A844ZEQ7_9SPHN|nr:tetratricopeptide repeat protein [Parapontixanthobacter aurantiacus]MXO85450.1 tetratricopeptide repeat protein [Parapontixanthobacter aurantiacus]
MRYAPAAAALSLALAVAGSVSAVAEPEASPRAAALVAKGEAALSEGRTQDAIDAFEAALTVDPAYTPIFNDLAAAARAQGLQGKAIRYYRETLSRDPRNFAAISGEGAAMVERGAIEKARQNLSRLESLCGPNCPETEALAAAIASPPVRTAEAPTPSGSEEPQAN